MNTSEKGKLEKQLKQQGYQYKASDDSYNKGNSRIIFDSNNGYNDSGITYRSYSTCKDHLDKKKN